MARARNIKPGFFKNDILAEVEPLGRLLFAGLWTIADREGRLEYRAKRIKAEVLPYDDCDINSLIDQLTEKGFIQVYEIEGNHYIQIANFNKHQNPHHQEKDSDLPTPDNNEIKPEVIPDKVGSNLADSLNPITDSLNPDPDSLKGGKNSNDDFQEVIKAFSTNIHPITPMEAETFTAWLDDGVEAGLIVWAIKQAVINGKRNARYIDAIIKNLNKEGITTLAGAEAKERDRRDYKEKGKARESPKKPKLSPEEKQEIEKMNRQIAELEGRPPG